MAALGPFEPRPEIAVAVSGGPDSLALTLLLHRWVQAHGGRLHALTVDHGLRPEAAHEAAWLGDQLARHGIAHTVLTWRPAEPGRVSHAEARAARYARLADWCADRGVLHLALGHHLDDQAETVLARVRMQSGPDGLAGMPARRHLPDLRLLRPLLDMPKARLEATLAARHQPWIADPSNTDDRYGRPRLRQLMPVLADDGLTPANLAAYARAMGQARRRLDGARAALAADAVAVRPEGYAAVDPRAILDAPAPVGTAVMGRVLRCIGGRDHVPRGPRLDRLMAALRARPEQARTLGGCRIVPWRGRWLVVREPGRAPRSAVRSTGELLYDNRFRIAVTGAAGADLFVACLGERGWAALCGEAPILRSAPLPPPVRPALPALFDATGVSAVPHLGWSREPDGARVTDLTFCPSRAIGESAFTVAPA
jgi:tRNA(Ile)-lysidine synthase